RPGELPALAGLGALGHLDLKIGGVDEVLAGDAEAPGRDLLDRAPAPIAVGVAPVARGVLAALAGIGPATDAVHGDGEGLVRLLADGAVGHGAGGEPPQDRLDRLDLLDRHGSSGRPAPDESKQGREMLDAVFAMA